METKIKSELILHPNPRIGLIRGMVVKRFTENGLPHATIVRGTAMTGRVVTLQEVLEIEAASGVAK